jgi:EmrB/QacA subfamily drug resistance transporter
MEVTQQPVAVPAIDYSKKYFVLIIVLTGVLMSVLDGFMVNIALPELTARFGADLALSQWVITGYLLAMTGLFIFFAKLSEFTGKSKLYILGFGLFTLSSMACGLAVSVEMLIGFRILQGIGAAMVSGISGAILFEAFPSEERGRAMGSIAATYGIIALIAPGFGGLVTEHFGWQAIFFVNVPIGLALIACALVYLPRDRPATQRLDMDWAGAAALIISAVSVMLFFSELASGLTITPVAAACGAVFVLSVAVFLFLETRCSKPLVDLAIFSDRKFTLPVISMTISYVVVMMLGILGPFYFQGVLGYSASQVGLLFMLSPLAMIFAAPLGGWLCDKYRWKYLAAAGMLVLGAACLLQGLAFMAISFWLIVAALILRGIGDGLFQSSNSVEIMSAVPPDKFALASGITSTTGNLANALGVLVASILLTLGLNIGGYHGTILAAGAGLLANTVGAIMLVAAGLCAIGVVLSALKNA